MMTNSKKRPFVIFSSLTENSTHLFRDNEFWFRNLIEIDKRTTLITFLSSIKELKVKFPDYKDNLFAFKDFHFILIINYRLHLLFKLMFCRPVKNSVIIFHGFDELAILYFFWRIRKWNNKIILILTNNVSPERLNRSRRLLPFLLKKIFHRSDYVFYHTDYEFRLIKQIIKNEIDQFKFKKHKYHLLGYNNKGKYKKEFSSKIITFFGPTMLTKPLNDICNLILADCDNFFHYRFININNEDEIFLKSFFGQMLNISIIKNYPVYDAYKEYINESLFVFLPHNSLYEGKLSGILSDCISMGTPIISDDIEPISKMFKTYGDMGYIYNYKSQTNWPYLFINGQTKEKYESFIGAMKKCSNDHSENIIMSEFLNSIEYY